MNPKTVKLGRGFHAKPEHGACVMELASMLAGERFTDRPLSVCPVIGAFLRAYNDMLDHRDRQELYPYAAMVVGSAARRSTRRRRARLLLEWAFPERATWRRRLAARIDGREFTMWKVARHAARLDRAHRSAEITALLESLLAVAGPHAAPAPNAVEPRVPV
jgi:hypothetical protein